MKLLKKKDLRLYRLQSLAQEICKDCIYSKLTRLTLSDLWVHFSCEKKGWSVWISFSQLSALLIPSISGMFVSETTKKNLSDIISSSTKIIFNEINIPALRKITSWDTEICESGFQGQLLSVETSNIKIFIENCPLTSTRHCFDITQFYNLSCPVDVTISSVYISLDNLKCLSSGDVILLKEIFFKLYSWNKEIHVKEWEKDTDMLDQFLKATSESPDTEISLSTEIESLNDLPVKVDVIIYSSFLTLSELDNIHKNGFFKLPTDAQNKCCLKVNGKIIAKGELVEFDENLAVEISEFMGEQR